jgi:phosphate uptake regulator
MLRKVIKQGPSTLMVSLPAKWAKANNISRGTELYVEEKPGQIQFRSSKKQQSKANVNVSGYPPQLIRKTVGALYKAGYDEIAVQYGTSAEFGTILSFSNNELIGFEIVEESGKTLLLKEVSALHPEEFDRMLRRAEMFVQSMAHDVYDAWRHGHWDELSRIEVRDLNINKLVNYCQRATHKAPSLFPEPFALYFCVEMLEKIGDGYKGITRELRATRLKRSQTVARHFEHMNTLVDIFCHQLRKFDIKKMIEYQQIKDTAVQEIIKAAEKAPRSEVRILYTFWTIMWFLYSALEDLFVLHERSLVESEKKNPDF